MTVLDDAQRRTLDRAVQRARTVAEAAAREAVSRLAVDRESRPDYLGAADNELRLALREKARLLGDSTRREPDLSLLIGDIAYEQWHRLLFARFLEVNGLLRHPDVPDVALTMADCAELAADEGEPDGWSVAARYAEAILPGVFRAADPAVRIRFSPERRAELDKIVADLDQQTLSAEDALGWVYQFWQTAEKKRVNESGRKIGGADLAPVTQLFTENYMVRFLLENSLGAWWAGRHPDSPLLAGWEYLRYLDDGTPAAGTFDEWPRTAAEVTVMDPCCGSGHFLVAAFGMLWRMRVEEEGRSPTDAQDAVLRDNLFGLELDPRCTQIAIFNVVLEAWKQGGFRELPVPQVACSGISINASREEWEKEVHATPELKPAMARLHTLFRHADSLGSLIDPTPRSRDAILSPDGTLEGAWGAVRSRVLQLVRSDDRQATVTRHAAEAIAEAADLLSRNYVLTATNPPFLSSIRQCGLLSQASSELDPNAKGNLAYTMWRRWKHSTQAFVVPQNWRYQVSYSALRRDLLTADLRFFISALGVNGFTTGMWDFHSDLVISRLSADRAILATDASAGPDPLTVSRFLMAEPIVEKSAASQLSNPDHRLSMTTLEPKSQLSNVAKAVQGICTGDYPHFGRYFWELPAILNGWERQQSTVTSPKAYGGRQYILLWESGDGTLRSQVTERLGEGREGSWIRGMEVLGKRGVVISQSGDLKATLYDGNLLDNNAAAIVPNDISDLPALWAFCASDDYRRLVRNIDSALKVTNRTLVKVPFDRERWQRVADEAGPLPEPYSDDPTQWLFKDTIPNATEPLQVAAARLLGYRWPDQEPDDLDELADADGIVALPALTGERDAATRLRAVLARAYGDEWSTRREHDLIRRACGKRIGLDDWLRDEFFKQHTKFFHHRPFLWHIWDGRKDGFAAIVNYHRLDRRVLEKLTYTVLGTWIDRQRTDAANDVAGADLRLAASLDLRRRLELILVGEDPYDIYVRWKTLAQQPIGWEPDLDDGVRLNIRPFVTAEVLRAKVNVSWKKDRGTNPNGTERHNDLHPTLAERRAARAVPGTAT